MGFSTPTPFIKQRDHSPMRPQMMQSMVRLPESAGLPNTMPTVKKEGQDQFIEPLTKNVKERTLAQLS